MTPVLSEETRPDTIYQDEDRIKHLLPHRGNWCFLREATLSLNETATRGSAQGRITCPYELVRGHHWALPGVLLIEMINQLGALLILHAYCSKKGIQLDPGAVVTWLKKTGECEFLKPVIIEPGKETDLECTAKWEYMPGCRQQLTGNIKYEGELVAKMITPTIGVIMVKGNTRPEKI